MNVTKRFVALLMAAVCLSTLAIPAYAASSDTSIRVGCFPLNGFFNFSNGELAGGYGADYTASVFQEAGIPYEYVVYPSWVEALDALSKSEIDILAPSQHTPERNALYSFDAWECGQKAGQNPKGEVRVYRRRKREGSETLRGMWSEDWKRHPYSWLSVSKLFTGMV